MEKEAEATSRRRRERSETAVAIAGSTFEDQLQKTEREGGGALKVLGFRVFAVCLLGIWAFYL